MASDLALLACGGALPIQIAEAHPDVLRLSLRGIPHQLGDTTQEHRIEQMGAMFEAMRAAGVTRIVFAGGLARPELDPFALDAVTIGIAPRLMAGFKAGDDALLSEVIDIFEEQGFAVIGAHELLPVLTADETLKIGIEPSADDLKDADRAWDILNALSPLDVGQGCVVAAGQCLGIETVQGTDALLRFVSQTEERLRQGAKGVFVKAAKRGQDLRVDMPAIGPKTIEAVAQAGLAGLVIEAGRVMILDRDATLKAVEDAGLFLSSRVM
ncbi:LpxI family protein [Roseovarius sp. 2305UL8-3]|uniref:LpxI family protein n=1 Tax=Roseovarius conchicola TaxID=3121636 RepID=UPI0035281B2F